MKRKLVLLLATVMVATLMTGCGGSKTKETEAQTEKATEALTESGVIIATEQNEIGTESGELVFEDDDLEDETETATEAVNEETTEIATEAVNEETTEAATEKVTEEATEAATEKVTEETTEAATETEKAETVILEDGTYSAVFDTDSSMFRVNEACDGCGTLTVKDGKMTIHVSLAGKGIVNLFVGTKEEAQKDGAEILQPTEDEVTYKDGYKETVYGFDIPVPVLDEEFDVALIGKKDKWYDHKVIVKDVQKAE